MLARSVVIGQGDHRVGGALPQVLRGDFTGLRVFLLPPCAAHVGNQAASIVPAEVLLRSRVELQVALWNQDRRHRIQQRGLAGARTSGDKETFARHRDGKVAVEGTPVNQLNAADAELAGVHAGVASHRKLPPSPHLPCSSSACARRAYSSRMAVTVEASKSWRSTGETSKRPSVSVALSSE